MTRRRMIIVGGGQSGLAAARAAMEAHWAPTVLEAGPAASGSWPSYYDSLSLFSPAELSGFPDFDFPGRPGHYPRRDEVASFLTSYAAWLDADITTDTRVTTVSARGDELDVHADDGRVFTGDAVIAASGSFGNPFVPRLPEHDHFRGRLLHVAQYRSHAEFTGERVVVVGAGNSAIQVAHELAEVARVSLAVRHPVRLVPQRRLGRDIHYWLRRLGLDRWPPRLLSLLGSEPLVFDTGPYEAGLASGRLDQRPAFSRFHLDGVVWADGTTEAVDTVIMATGYRPDLPYLADLGALDATGAPRHHRGLSTVHPGLAFLGLEFQQTFSSNTLRGVHRDAHHVVRGLTAIADRRTIGTGARDRVRVPMA
ncbi:flavin-containing monooxygenase [Microlunatus sp. Y2014]|uniref:flavin-containing monooxygenase n=1 Tax=Microlunatus sp. Y2014 TaxID=3418488 RepID=UPI003DA7100C